MIKINSWLKLLVFASYCIFSARSISKESKADLSHRVIGQAMHDAVLCHKGSSEYYVGCIDSIAQSHTDLFMAILLSKAELDIPQKSNALRKQYKDKARHHQKTETVFLQQQINLLRIEFRNNDLISVFNFFKNSPLAAVNQIVNRSIEDMRVRLEEKMPRLSTQKKYAALSVLIALHDLQDNFHVMLICINEMIGILLQNKECPSERIMGDLKKYQSRGARSLSVRLGVPTVLQSTICGLEEYVPSSMVETKAGFFVAPANNSSFSASFSEVSARIM